MAIKYIFYPICFLICFLYSFGFKKIKAFFFAKPEIVKYNSFDNNEEDTNEKIKLINKKESKGKCNSELSDISLKPLFPNSKDLKMKLKSEKDKNMNYDLKKEKEAKIILSQSGNEFPSCIN